jgi:hypothetical protein
VDSVKLNYLLAFVEAFPMKVKLTLLLAIGIFQISCKKDGKGCWQAFDPLGYDATGLLLCDKTKAEAEAAWPQFWFYRSGETKYCWREQLGTNSYYVWGIPQSMVNKYVETNGAYQFTKIDCSSFCVCQWYEKHRSKITGLYDPTLGIVETLSSTDSCSKLFVGRIIVVRETADSLITRELIKKDP